MLSKTEMALLKFLMMNDAGADRTTILSEVFGYQPMANTHTLETHVWRIRRKIEREPKAPMILLTQPGGYRLNVGLDVPGSDDWQDLLDEASQTCPHARRALARADGQGDAG